MNSGLSSTQLLHGFQYHQYRQEYEARKRVENQTSTHGSHAANDVSALLALEQAHGYRRFPGIDAVIESVVRPPASPVPNAHAERSSFGSPRSTPQVCPASPSISARVADTVAQLCLRPPTHAALRSPTASPIERPCEALEWTPHTLVPRFPFTQVVTSVAPAGGSWLPLALCADSARHCGTPSADNSRFGCGEIPDPTLDNATPNARCEHFRRGELAGGRGVSPEGVLCDDDSTDSPEHRRVRNLSKVEEQQRRARAALWKKITYGLSSSGLPQVGDSSNARGGKAVRGAPFAPGMGDSLKPGRLVSIRRHRQAGATDPSRGTAASTAETPAPQAGLVRTFSSWSPLPDVASPSPRESERIGSCGDLPSKHDVTAAIAAAKAHFAASPFRSVFTVTALPPALAMDDLFSESACTTESTTQDSRPDMAGSCVPSPMKSYQMRLVETGLTAALLSCAALSVSPADYRLASAIHTIKPYFPDRPLHIRAWGISDPCVPAANDGEDCSKTAVGFSMFPGKWLIASPEHEPWNAVVAIAWDPFPASFSEASPPTEAFDYSPPSHSELLSRQASDTLRCTFLTFAEEAARSYIDFLERAERDSISLAGAATSYFASAVVATRRNIELQWLRGLIGISLRLKAAHRAHCRRLQLCAAVMLERHFSVHDIAAPFRKWLRWRSRRAKADGRIRPIRKGSGHAEDAALELSLTHMRSAWHRWRMHTSGQVCRRALASASSREATDATSVQMHREAKHCAALVCEGVRAAVEHLGLHGSGHGLTVVGHGAGGTVACAVAVMLNVELAQRHGQRGSAASLVHTAVTIGSPRLTRDDPRRMFHAARVEVVAFGAPSDPAISLPACYAPLSVGLFHMDGAIAELTCVATSQIPGLSAYAHEHWRLNNIDMYVARLVAAHNWDGGVARTWANAPGEPDAALLGAEFATLSATPQTLRRASRIADHGFKDAMVDCLADLHSYFASKATSRVDRRVIAALLVQMTPPQPVQHISQRLPEGRKGLIDFMTFVQWLWQEHVHLPGFLTSFLEAAGWKWVPEEHQFARHSHAKISGLVSTPVGDAPLKLRCAATSRPARRDWSFTPAARVAIDHIFSHYSRVIPVSPLDTFCSGVPVATFNCLVLLLQHSRWTHPCAPPQAVSALLTVLEQAHVAQPRRKLMSFNGALTSAGFSEFLALLVDWFGEPYMTERLWVLGYNGLFQHSVIRGTLRNIHARGASFYDFQAEDRWLARLRQREERQFTDFVTSQLEELQREKLRASQAASFRRVQTLRSGHRGSMSLRAHRGSSPAPIMMHVGGDEVVSSVASESGANDDDDGSEADARVALLLDSPQRQKQRRPKARQQSRSGGGARRAQSPSSTARRGNSALRAVRGVYSQTTPLKMWTATGQDKSGWPTTAGSGDTFTAKVETSVSLPSRHQQQQQQQQRQGRHRRQQRRKPETQQRQSVNAPHRLDSLYLLHGVVHLLNPTQRLLLGHLDCTYDDDRVVDEREGGGSIPRHVDGGMLNAERANRTI